MIEDHSQGVNVDRRTHLTAVAAGLLGSHVLGGAHREPGPRQAGLALHRPGQAEVGDLGHKPAERVGPVAARPHPARVGLLGRLHQDIRRLEVAVDHPLPVRRVDRPGERADQERRRTGRPRRAVEPVGQRAALDPLHRQVRPVPHLTDLIDLDDVGVPDPGGELRLALEPQPLRRGGELAG